MRAVGPRAWCGCGGYGGSVTMVTVGALVPAVVGHAFVSFLWDICLAFV